MYANDGATLVQTEISTTIGHIATTFCADIHGTLRMNPTDFGDLSTFPLAPTSGQSYKLNEWNISSWIGSKFSSNVRGSQKMYSNDFYSRT